MDVMRIEDVTDLMTTFDETGIQIISIIFTFCVLCILTPIFIFGPTGEPDFFYMLISITIILVANVVLFLNLLPRTIAVIKGGDDNDKEY